MHVEGGVLYESGKVAAAAWAATDDGQVIVGPTGRAYLGVAITESAREKALRFGTASVLHTRGRDGWQVLKYGLPRT